MTTARRRAFMEEAVERGGGAWITTTNRRAGSLALWHLGYQTDDYWQAVCGLRFPLASTSGEALRTCKGCRKVARDLGRSEP